MCPFPQHFDCRNHIRVIQPMSKNRLYICGTNAHNPKDWVIYVSNLLASRDCLWVLFTMTVFLRCHLFVC